MTRLLRVLRYHDRDEFARRVEAFLIRHEAENCFFLGALTATGAGVPPDVLRLVIEDERGEVVAVAMKWPKRHLMMTDAPPAAVDALVDYFVDGKIPLQGVQSRPHLAARFAERYAARAGLTARPHTGMAVYVLTEVRPVRGVAGSLRPAREPDAELLARWAEAFCRDCGLPAQPPGGELVRARERIARGDAFLWEVDGRPVCSASVHGPTPNGIRINAVYTPDEYRSRGFASACVAALSQRMLDSGRKFCFLYTDLANPTSNKIYRAIGYEKVCEDEQIFFDSEAAPDDAT
jgi:predicted GNAT family acetyltransferase